MYIEYKPLSQKPDSSTFIPFELFQAQKIAISKIDKKITADWDKWVCDQIDISKEELWDKYSSEQIDSIGLTIYNFLKNNIFIIGDETGIGKGRILSGIARWAWKNNLKVLFFTEREHLMSEFWKDLSDTNNLDLLSNPIAYHSDSKIFNPDLSVALRGTKKIVQTIEKEGFSDDTNLVLTNYSQISLKNHTKQKLKHLEKFCENAVLILDESHNATGDSNTKAFLLKLRECAKQTVFSSATFIKDESQFDLYENGLNFDEQTLKLMKKLLTSDKFGILRKIFTYELTKNLQLWRREHQPLQIGWQTVFCNDEEYIQEYIDLYSKTINKLFNIVNKLQNDSIETEMLKNAWFSLGATINRLSRNLLLILKIPSLIESIKENIKLERKAVIVIDSTLSSLVQKINIKNKLNEEDSDNAVDDTVDPDNIIEKNFALNFQEGIKYIIDEILEEYMESHSDDKELLDDYNDLISLTEKFSNLTISPIDTIKEQLQLHNISCGEISGRKTFIQNNKIEKLKLPSKTKIVKEFNDGITDVLIITRAGASGISAHASAAFKDQKVRTLYELEITNRPTYRLQFMGRVNRKNQVHQPLFFSVVTRLPFEQRILNIEQNKLKKLQAHISGDDEKLGQENILNLFNSYTNQCAFDYLKNNPYMAYQMGISLKGGKDEYYYIDSILKRCIVLPSETQNQIYDFLTSTVFVFKDLELRKNIPDNIEITNIKTFWHQLDTEQQQKFTKIYGKMPYLSINQFQFPWVGLASTKYTFTTNFVFDKNLQKEFNENLKNKELPLKIIKQSFIAFQKNEFYNQEFIEKTAKPIIKNLDLGDQLIIESEHGKVFGYLHNIQIPKINNPEKYPGLIILHIKTINPHLHSSVFYAQEDYFLTLTELIEANFIEINKKPINWGQYSRPNRELNKENFCLIGHPVYLQFLQHSYNIGHIEYIKFNNEYKMCYILPPIFKQEEILRLKRPIYQTNEIMNLFIKRKINLLTTNWERNTEKEKASIKIETTSGGYHVLVAQEISRNSEVIDYPVKQKLKKYKGLTKDGYYYYFVPYKEIRMILFMLEKRGVVWFYEKF